MNTADAVTGETHYHEHPSGIECWAVAELMNFNLGNALKYMWRYKLKGNPRVDLLKAANYLQREARRAGAGFYTYPPLWYEQMQYVISCEDDPLVKLVFGQILASGGQSIRPLDNLKTAASLLRDAVADYGDK